MFLWILYQNSLWNALSTNTSLGSDVLRFFVANQGLRHTFSPDALEIAVISCIDDVYLFSHFGEALVTDHRRVWGYTSEDCWCSL